MLREGRHFHRGRTFYLSKERRIQGGRKCGAFFQGSGRRLREKKSHWVEKDYKLNSVCKGVLFVSESKFWGRGGKCVERPIGLGKQIEALKVLGW